MNNFFKNKLIAIIFTSIMFFCGCATESKKIVSRLDSNSVSFKSAHCQNSIKDIDFHSDMKKAKTIAIPVAIIMSGGLLAVPAIITSAGLSTIDNIDATNISSRCGGKVSNNKDKIKNIAKDALIDSATVIPLF